jgi:hypothetical protein
MEVPVTLMVMPRAGVHIAPGARGGCYLPGLHLAPLSHDGRGAGGEGRGQECSLPFFYFASVVNPFTSSGRTTFPAWTRAKTPLFGEERENALTTTRKPMLLFLLSGLLLLR